MTCPNCGYPYVGQYGVCPSCKRSIGTYSDGPNKVLLTREQEKKYNREERLGWWISMGIWAISGVIVACIGGVIGRNLFTILIAGIIFCVSAVIVMKVSDRSWTIIIAAIIVGIIIWYFLGSKIEGDILGLLIAEAILGSIAGFIGGLLIHLWG
jgi:hypothetical protein